MLEFLQQAFFWGFYGLIFLSLLFVIVVSFFVQKEKYELRAKRGK